jgi:endonuclease/exonuclease/phosphatase (EEP) superfamily protein YafD
LSIYGKLFVPSLPASISVGETPLTIMSFNIWGGSHSEETVQVILSDDMPDTVALQELTPRMARVLVGEIGDMYPYRILAPASKTVGMGVFSRYPLTSLDTKAMPGSGWPVQAVQVNVGARSYVLYNVHLEPTNVLDYIEIGAPIAEEVEASFRTREQQARWLAADIADRQGPVIVVGDFNMTDQSDAYTILARHLYDSHHAVGWGLGHTFPAYAGNFRGLPIIPRQMRLDMIFYSEDFVALTSRVSFSHGESDHLPVLAQLAWRR